MTHHPRRIVRVHFDPYHSHGYIALCNDGTVWYGTHKMVRNAKGGYDPSPDYWIRLPDIPQEEIDEG